MNIIEQLIKATAEDKIEWEETSSYLAFLTRYNEKAYIISQSFTDTIISVMNENYDFVDIDEFTNTDVLKDLYSIIMNKYPEFRKRVTDCLRDLREYEGEELHMKKKVNLTPELAEKLDGRCFLDLDDSDRIEAFRFVKTTTGLDMIGIGCDYHWGYSHLWHDDYGEYNLEDTFCGCYIDMIEENSWLVREITQEKFDRANEIVNEKISENKKMQRDFEKLQKQFGLLGEK